MTSLSGILNLAKPPGMTSRRALDVVGRLIRPNRAGHAGTLDPLATGVLVICIGQATRLIEYVQQMPKTYEATFLLGRTSDTEDVEGTVVELIDPPVPTREQIDRAAAALVGDIMQRPPAFSALKVQGRRAYDLARAGEQVDLAPRPIQVYGIDVLAYDYPTLQASRRSRSTRRSFARFASAKRSSAATPRPTTRSSLSIRPANSFRCSNGSGPSSGRRRATLTNRQTRRRAASVAPDKAVLPLACIVPILRRG